MIDLAIGYVSVAMIVGVAIFQFALAYQNFKSLKIGTSINRGETLSNMVFDVVIAILFLALLVVGEWGGAIARPH